jgi:hypothetical protein
MGAYVEILNACPASCKIRTGAGVMPCSNLK